VPVAPIETASLARLGQALADPTRCHVLLVLRDGPAYPTQLAERLGVSRPMLSNHLATLRDHGLVVTVPEGRRLRYELADQRLAEALTAATSLMVEIDPAAFAAPHCLAAV
jgi:DNA-binding transcriptional ArsR family regulator